MFYSFFMVISIQSALINLNSRQETKTLIFERSKTLQRKNNHLSPSLPSPFSLTFSLFPPRIFVLSLALSLSSRFENHSARLFTVLTIRSEHITNLLRSASPRTFKRQLLLRCCPTRDVTAWGKTSSVAVDIRYSI